MLAPPAEWEGRAFHAGDETVEKHMVVNGYGFPASSTERPYGICDTEDEAFEYIKYLKEYTCADAEYLQEFHVITIDYTHAKIEVKET